MHENVWIRAVFKRLNQTIVDFLKSEPFSILGFGETVLGHTEADILLKPLKHEEQFYQSMTINRVYS